MFWNVLIIKINKIKAKLTNGRNKKLPMSVLFKDIAVTDLTEEPTNYSLNTISRNLTLMFTLHTAYLILTPN